MVRSQHRFSLVTALVCSALALLTGGLGYLFKGAPLEWLTNGTATALLVVGLVLIVRSCIDGSWRVWDQDCDQ